MKSYDLKLEKHSTSKAIADIIEDPKKLHKLWDSIMNNTIKHSATWKIDHLPMIKEKVGKNKKSNFKSIDDAD